MVDINEEQLDTEDNLSIENDAAPEVESPLVNLVNKISALFGGGKNNSSSSKKGSASPKPVHVSVQGTDDKPIDKNKAPEGYYGDPLMTVVVRNNFYRDGFRSMMKIALAEAIIIVMIVLTFVAYMYVSKPKDHYFATTSDGRIMQLVPLNQPNMNTSALMSWVAQSATEIMTFGYHDYQRRMQQSSRHFTRYGWESFTNALQKSRIIESVEASGQVVTAQPRSAPILIQEGVFNNKYRWVVDLPLTVSYRAGNSGRTDELMIRLVIDRVTSLENPNGVGIEQWIAIAK